MNICSCGRFTLKTVQFSLALVAQTVDLLLCTLVFPHSMGLIVCFINVIILVEQASSFIFRYHLFKIANRGEKNKCAAVYKKKQVNAKCCTVAV